MKILCITLLIGCIFINGCDSPSALRDTVSAEPALTPSVSARSDVTNINFQGVSFSYNKAIFGSAKLSDVPEYELKEPDNKPDGVAPRHALFEFELGREYRKAEMAVYPIKGFPLMYSRNPNSERHMRDQIESLKNVIKDANIKPDEEIPYLPYVDATWDFHSKVKPFSFQSGKGVLYVTHWSHGVGLISNERLQYVFQGLTEDGEYYIVANMPVTVKFLPDDSSIEEFEG